jgi:hypothetical protein
MERNTTDVAAMEPTLPEEASRDLEDIAVDLVAKANSLTGQIHPIVTRFNRRSCPSERAPKVSRRYSISYTAAKFCCEQLDSSSFNPLPRARLNDAYAVRLNRYKQDPIASFCQIIRL